MRVVTQLVVFAKRAMGNFLALVVIPSAEKFRSYFFLLQTLNLHMEENKRSLSTY